MKKGRHWSPSFRDGPRAYEFGRHERHVHDVTHGDRWRCVGCGKLRHTWGDQRVPSLEGATFPSVWAFDLSTTRLIETRLV